MGQMEVANAASCRQKMLKWKYSQKLLQEGTQLKFSQRQVCKNWGILMIQNSCIVAILLHFSFTGSWSESELIKIASRIMIPIIVIGIAVGQFTDHIRKHIKVTLIFMLLFSTGAYVWLTLLILKVIPYSLIQLYASTICGSGCITAIMTLFFEYTVEMSYPVPEGIVGGLLTGGNNVVSYK